MESLLNFDQNTPLNVPLLDQIVSTFFSTTDNQTRHNLQEILLQFQKHPWSWSKVSQIITESQNLQSKYVGLQILEEFIKTRWKTLEAVMQEELKNGLLSLVTDVARTQANVSDPNTKLLLNKMDLLIVQIIKQEWPRKWEAVRVAAAGRPAEEGRGSTGQNAGESQAGATSRTCHREQTADGPGNGAQVRVKRCGKSAPASRATAAAR